MTDSASDNPRLAAHGIAVADGLRRSRRRWRVLAVLALIVAGLAVTARVITERGGSDQVARIEVIDTIATDPARLKAIVEAAGNPNVKAILVSINSPGGTTAGGEELYEALMAARAKKPVVAVIKELGASAAYMTAIASDRIFARRLSIVGSIGVLYQHVDAGKLLGTIGIDLDKVATGPLKAEPEIDGPIKPEVRASIESLVRDSFDWFVAIVAERRGLTFDQTLLMADGRILTGRQGIEAGLIDAVGGEAEALDWLEAEKGLGADLPVVTHYPLPDNGIDWVADFLGGQARGALGLPGRGPIVLDGLVSLWQGTSQ